MNSILFFEPKIYVYHMRSPEQYCPKRLESLYPARKQNLLFARRLITHNLTASKTIKFD